MNMTPEQMRELDCWVETHVFGRTDIEFIGRPGSVCEWDADKPEPRHFTTSPADAMAVLEKCAEKCGQVKINHPSRTVSGFWLIRDMDHDTRTRGETLPLAICLFAKQLFGKAEQ